MSEEISDYGLAHPVHAKSIPTPRLNYEPRFPADLTTPIGLIGAGGISQHHLAAYRNAGLNVVAICDIDHKRADERRQAFYPYAAVFDDYHQLLADESIVIVDVATHPRERVPIVELAIRAGKHVLSQKPFVEDLSDGERLVQLAQDHGVQLAVNQNGRWAPHFSYLREAVHGNLIGDVSSVDFVMQWDHTWTADTPFNQIHHLLLYDFAIHWFDMATVLMGDAQPERVWASVRRSSYQRATPPFLTHVGIDYPTAQVRLALNANVIHGQEDRTTVVGETGTIRSFGPSINEQTVELWTEQGVASPKLHGRWFDTGFAGTMGELMCAIAENRQPSNNAADNLRSLALCFAAISSADTGQPVRPGDVRST